MYKPCEQVVNVFVLPKSRADSGETLSRRVYSLRHWEEGDLSFWAVFDAARVRAVIPGGHWRVRATEAR